MSARVTKDAILGMIDEDLAVAEVEGHDEECPAFDAPEDPWRCACHRKVLLRVLNALRDRVAALAPSERDEAVAWEVVNGKGEQVAVDEGVNKRRANELSSDLNREWRSGDPSHIGPYRVTPLYRATPPAPEPRAEGGTLDERIGKAVILLGQIAKVRDGDDLEIVRSLARQAQALVDEFDRRRASSPPAAAAEGEDAENFRALKRLMAVGGAGWSVRHPREDDGQWYFGFGFPMTGDEVRGAIERGGLGWAPSLEGALRNAADTIDAARAPRKGDSDVQ